MSKLLLFFKNKSDHYFFQNSIHFNLDKSFTFGSISTLPCTIFFVVVVFNYMLSITVNLINSDRNVSLGSYLLKKYSLHFSCNRNWFIRGTAVQLQETLLTILSLRAGLIDSTCEYLADGLLLKESAEKKEK